MQKKLHLLFVGILFITSAYSQIPEAGLVGYYKLDDGAYVDFSTSGYNLELVDIGGILLPSQDRFGQPDKALKFINQYLNMDSNPNVFDFNTTSTFSLCAWIKIDETIIDWTGLLNNWAGFGIGGYYLGVTPTQQIRWNVNVDPPIDSSPVATGEWIHVAVSYDGVTSKLYLNGLLVGSEIYGVSILPSPFSFSVACQADVTTNQFPGTMDDILVYDRQLTDQEVEDIVNVLSIEDVTAFSKNISITPNPVEMSFAFTYDTSLGTLVSYQITDIKGVSLMENSIDPLQQTVDISQLSAGVYLITFQSIDGMSISKRIVKK